MIDGTTAVDLEAASKFIEAVAGDSPVTFQTFTDNKPKPLPPNWKDPLARKIHGSLSDKASQLVTLNRKRAGIYLMLNEGDLQGRSNKNVIKIRAVFADLNGSPLTSVEHSKLPPHIITETSCGKYHCIWKVSDMPLDRFGIIQKAIAERFNSDSSVTDLARVVRIPGFFHLKEEPFRSRLMVCDGDSTPYTMDQIIEGLEIADLIKRKETKRGPRKTADISTDKIVHPGRHKHLISKAGKMRFDGLTEEAIEVALQKENQIRCDPPLPSSEVTEMREQYEHQAKSQETTADQSAPCNETVVKPTRFQKLLTTFREIGAEVFLDQHSTGWVCFKCKGIYRNVKLSSSEFKRHLLKLYHEAHNDGVGKEVIGQVTDLLEAQAENKRGLHNRSVMTNGRLHIDLGTATWEAIEVTKTGWRIVNLEQPPFKRFAHQQPLPVPQSGGNVREILKYLPLDNQRNFVLATPALNQGLFSATCNEHFVATHQR
ncbi:MAG: DNA-primase RepB domain-containing protein [Desulfomonilaceae bacterium]